MCQQRCSSLIARKEQAEVVLRVVWRRSLLVPQGPRKAEAQLLVDLHHCLHWTLGQESWVCGRFLFSSIRSSLLLFQCWFHQDICKVLNSDKTIHLVIISRKWRGGEWTIKRTVTLWRKHRLSAQAQPQFILLPFHAVGTASWAPAPPPPPPSGLSCGSCSGICTGYSLALPSLELFVPAHPTHWWSPEKLYGQKKDSIHKDISKTHQS